MRSSCTHSTSCHFAQAPFSADESSANITSALMPLAACPSVAELHRPVPSQPLARSLLRLLSGHRLAVLGDSMSRQLFSTLVGHLREQETFLDSSTWHPARYTLYVQGGSRGHSCLRDHLDLFWQPDPTLAETGLPRRPSNGSLSPETEWSAAFVADWIMLPRFDPLAVENGLRLLRAAHRTTNYTLVFLLVPAAWHIREAFEKQMAFNQSTWRLPLTFWDALRAESNRMSGARFAAITMPIEHIACSRDDTWRSYVHDQCAIQGRCGRRDGAVKRKKHLSMSTTGEVPGSLGLKVRQGNLSAFDVGIRSCTAHTCCRRAMVSYRNEFADLPERWVRIDFAAITNTTRPPSLGWHYECQIQPEQTRRGESGVRECAELAMRLKFDKCNTRYAEWFAAAQKMPRILRQEPDVECREMGNTAFWQHVVAGPVL